jgi:predicted MPP superfamily phosphohydrolase
MKEVEREERNGAAEALSDRERPAVDTGRRDFLRKSVSGLTIISVSGPSLGNISGDEEFEVVNKTVRMPGLPEKLRGFRIAMISDIHSGPYMDYRDIAPYVDRINRLRPDAIVLPGDFVQNRNEEIEPVCDIFRKFEAPYGVYGSTGNHDYFADADHIARELGNAGVTMLRNSHAKIDVKGEELALIGLDDVRSGHPFDALFRQAVEGLKPGTPNVLLCHKPYYLEEASEWGVDLMVSGHTHGGQIVLARVFGTVITPAALISGYVEGLYRLDRTQLYVTRGIGTVGLPVRINCPPEITILTLT